jgi:peptidoglycan/LPS O-acetylase OafA/YrhL
LEPHTIKNLKILILQSNTLGRPYYPALDGLRGIAIILVLLYHNFGFVTYFKSGWVGVDLFFVLSGFLITEILLRTKGSPFFLRSFYMRRFLRIFPLYYLCLLVVIIIIPATERPFYDVDYYKTNQLWFWMYLQNWLYIFKHPEQSALLNHLWSLAVEEQFYLIWPLVILFTKSLKTQFRIVMLLLAVVMISRITFCFIHPYHISYGNLYTFSRIDGLCIGCGLALLQKIDFNLATRYSRKILMVVLVVNVLIVSGIYFLHLNVPYTALIGYTSIAILFGLLLHKTIEIEKNQISRFLSTVLFRFFGKISYSLYIFHWPIYLVLVPVLKHLLSAFLFLSEFDNQAISAIIATACALLLSVISYHFFEKYFLSLKKLVA